MTSHTATVAGERRTVALLVFGFAVALAAASQVAIPIPGTPVPMTLQPLVVALAGLWLGPLAGAASMVLYIAMGVAGLPVFAPIPGLPMGAARLLGPTGGYILAYPIAAYLAGLVRSRRPDFLGRVLGAALAVIAIHLGGFVQLLAITGGASQALALGATPFLLFDGVKILAAAALSPKRVF